MLVMRESELLSKYSRKNVNRSQVAVIVIVECTRNTEEKNMCETKQSQVDKWVTRVVLWPRASAVDPGGAVPPNAPNQP